MKSMASVGSVRVFVRVLGVGKGFVRVVFDGVIIGAVWVGISGFLRKKVRVIFCGFW